MGVAAPMVTLSPPTVTPFSASIPSKLTRVPAEFRRCFIVGIRV